MIIDHFKSALQTGLELCETQIFRDKWRDDRQRQIYMPPSFSDRGITT